FRDAREAFKKDYEYEWTGDEAGLDSETLEYCSCSEFSDIINEAKVM
ncbi:MAG: hypothetical protein EZS28_037375, partial [Streblomastix strix]